MSYATYPSVKGRQPRGRGRGYAGLSKLRKTFKRLPPTLQRDISQTLEWAGKEVMIDAVMIANMKDIRQSGDMIESISFKLHRDGSSVLVGPSANKASWQSYGWDTRSKGAQNLSIKQKDAQWQYFKAYWAEFGTQPHSLGGGRQHPGIQPRSFMEEAWNSNAPGVTAKVNKVVNETLRTVVTYG